MSNDEFAKVSG